MELRDQQKKQDILIKKTGATYCLTGTIENSGKKLVLTIELSSLLDRSVLWIDRIEGRIDDIHQLRSDVVNKVIGTLEIHVSAQEAKYARLKSPENLDAWSAYHLALEHVYRFSEHDNAVAIQLFERAVRLEPTFARAHAGLSFAQFQNAFKRYAGIDVASTVKIVRASAERSIELDRLDPFANFVMGRSCWLDGQPEDCLPWIKRAVAINPNYAHGYYVQGLAALMSNQSENSEPEASMAISISPLDPFLYGFYGIRAFSHIAQGNYQDAYIWADQSARQPNAAPVMDLVALAASSLAGSEQGVQYWVTRIRQQKQVMDGKYFFRALPFQEGKIRNRIRQALAKYDL
ncbi:MAG: hypothetical protein N2F24_14935 [Deltaproteobacteria bacterium]